MSRWDVCFPRYQRVLQQAYLSITSARLHQVLQEALAAAPGCTLLLGTAVRRMSAHAVHLEDGRTLTGRLVIDARGPAALPLSRIAGYQKFVGLEVELAQAARLTQPIIMDATVPQTDGFRFVVVGMVDLERVESAGNQSFEKIVAAEASRMGERSQAAGLVDQVDRRLRGSALVRNVRRAVFSYPAVERLAYRPNEATPHEGLRDQRPRHGAPFGCLGNDAVDVDPDAFGVELCRNLAQAPHAFGAL